MVKEASYPLLSLGFSTIWRVRSGLYLHLSVERVGSTFNDAQLFGTDSTALAYDTDKGSGCQGG